MGRKRELIGERFGKLVVLEESGKNKNKEILWLCQCDCGNKTLVPTYSLTSGNTKSCGCSRGIHGKHGAYKGGKVERLYRVWLRMKTRCSNHNVQEYRNYGERGIRVCEEWEKSYASFREWALENGYNPNAKQGECTIDRIDNNKGYFPDNCRWVSMKEQSINRRCNVFLTINGERMVVSEAAKKYNVPYDTLLARHHMGWKDEDAIMGRKGSKNGLDC